MFADNHNNDNDQRSEQYESFGTTISMLKKIAAEDGTTINDDAIIEALSINREQFHVFLEEDKAPAALFDLLRSTYPKYLKARYDHVVLHSIHEIDDPEIEPYGEEEE